MGLGLPAGQFYAHTLVEGNVEWGKEAKGTEAADYHDYFEVTVSPSLPLVRSRQLNYGTAGNGAFITTPPACLWKASTSAPKNKSKNAWKAAN